MKRKLLAIILASVLLVAMIPGLSAAATGQISVLIEGRPVAFADQGPVVVDGRTLVPVRGVFEELGFEVNWNAATSQVTLSGEGNTVVITIGSRTFTANGTSRTLDVPAQTIGGRTMLPLRLVLESVGYYLGWDAGAQVVLISASPDPTLPTGFTPLPAPAPTTPPTTLPAPAPVQQNFVGSWYWLEDVLYYTFNADGTGLILNEMPIRWWISGNVLYICITPEDCADNCSLPMQWLFEISGNSMTLTSIDGEFYEYGTYFNYIRR